MALPNFPLPDGGRLDPTKKKPSSIALSDGVRYRECNLCYSTYPESYGNTGQIGFVCGSCVRMFNIPQGEG